jgi:hypothetical protein
MASGVMKAQLLKQGSVVMTHSPIHEACNPNFPPDGTSNGNVVAIFNASNTTGIPVNSSNRAVWTTFLSPNPKPMWWAPSDPSKKWTADNLGKVFGITLDEVGNIYVSNTSIYGGESGVHHDKIFRLDGSNGGAISLVFDFSSIFPTVTSQKGLGNIKHFKIGSVHYIAATWWETGKIYILKEPSGGIASSQQWTIHAQYDPSFNNKSQSVPYGVAVRPSPNPSDPVPYQLVFGEYNTSNTGRFTNIYYMGLDISAQFTGTESLASITGMPTQNTNCANTNGICSVNNNTPVPIADISFSSDYKRMVVGQQALCSPDRYQPHNSRVQEFIDAGSFWNAIGKYPCGNLNTYTCSPGTLTNGYNSVGGVTYSNNILFQDNQIHCDTTILFSTDLIYMGSDYIQGNTNFSIPSAESGNFGVITGPATSPQTVATVYGFQGLPSNNTFTSNSAAFNYSLKVDANDSYKFCDKWSLGDIEAFNVPLVCSNPPNCCEAKIEVSSPNLTPLPSRTNAPYNEVAGSIKISSDKSMSEVRMNVEEFRLSANSSHCLLCNNKPISWGNIISATLKNIIAKQYDGTALPAPTINTDNREAIFNNGQPMSLTNDSLKFRLNLPEGTDLSCCKVTIYLCVKLTFKDIDCKECEKIICYEVTLGDSTSTPPPPSSCSCGTWDSTKVSTANSATLVTNNGTVSNISAEQNVLITPSFKCSPVSCEPKYTWNYSGPTSGQGTAIPFSISSAKNGTYTVTITAMCGTIQCPPQKFSVVVGSITPPNNCVCSTPSQAKRIVKVEAENDQGDFTVDCTTNGDNEIALSPYGYSFTAPTYTCTPNSQNCPAIYRWEIKRTDVVPPVKTYLTGQTIQYNFSAGGTYMIAYLTICGGRECGTCGFKVKVNKSVQKCSCGQWKNDIPEVLISSVQTATSLKNKKNATKELELQSSKLTNKVSCQSEVSLPSGTYKFDAPQYDCQGCNATYRWGVVEPNSTGAIIGNPASSMTIPMLLNGTYSIKLYAYCGDKICDSCFFTVIIKKGKIGKEGQINLEDQMKEIGMSLLDDRLVFKSIDAYRNIIEDPSGELEHNVMDAINTLTNYKSYKSWKNEHHIEHDNDDIPDEYFSSLLNQDKIIQIGDYIFKIIPQQEKVLMLPVRYINEYPDLLRENISNRNIKIYSTTEDILDVLGGNTSGKAKKAGCKEPGINSHSSGWIFFNHGADLRRARAKYFQAGIFFSLFAEIYPAFNQQFLFAFGNTWGYIHYKQKCGWGADYATISSGNANTQGNQRYQSYKGTKNLTNMFFKFRVLLNGTSFTPFDATAVIRENW